MIFLSHNSGDKDVAREIGIYLIAEDVSVWFDEWEIAAGDSIVEQINEGLKDCTHFLIIWSENAERANWVRRELTSALARAVGTGVPRLLPVILDDTPLPELLRDIRYIRWNGGTEADRRNLIQAVTGEAPSRNLIRAVVEKYHEVIRDEDDPIFGLAVCPRCGSGDLSKSSATDYARDEVNYFASCRHCNWSDWTQ